MVRLFIILFFISFSLISQKPSDKIKVKKLPVDTIDYTYMNSYYSYTLLKVEGKSGHLPYNCPKALMFMVGINYSYSNYYNSIYGDKFSTGDTVMFMTWYVIDNIRCLGQNCDQHSNVRYSKIRINSSSNVFNT